MTLASIRVSSWSKIKWLRDILAGTCTLTLAESSCPHQAGECHVKIDTYRSNQTQTQAQPQPHTRCQSRQQQRRMRSSPSMHIVHQGMEFRCVVRAHVPVHLHPAGDRRISLRSYKVYSPEHMAPVHMHLAISRTGDLTGSRNAAGCGCRPFGSGP